MNAHRVKVLDGANDNDVVVFITHHFHFVLFPADDRFFDQNFCDWRLIQPVLDERIEFLFVVRNRTAAAAHGEAWANHGR